MTTHRMNDDEYVLSYLEIGFLKWHRQNVKWNSTLKRLKRSVHEVTELFIRRYKDRGREEGAQRLYADYFKDGSNYFPEDFTRRFRMQRTLFNRILFELESHNPYFTHRRDATGRLRLTFHQKMTAALRMLAYGAPADAIDEYVRIGQLAVIESLGKFCMTIYRVFGPRYLREPTSEDIARLSQQNAARGFPGCLGSVDCMHREWKNCPTGWADQFQGHVPAPTIILEAVASHDTWIWHAFFGMPGSANDLNVLQKSHLFTNLLHSHAPPTDFEVNGHQYNMGYYFGHGIYPCLATIVKAFKHPISKKKVKFTAQQQGCRKDVERAFGILQARWRIVAGPTRLWNPTMWHMVMMTCIILHNMIVEDEIPHPEWKHDYEQRGNIPEAESEHGGIINEAYSEMNRKLTDRTTHFQLRKDLVEHQWYMHGMGLLHP